MASVGLLGWYTACNHNTKTRANIYKFQQVSFDIFPLMSGNSSKVASMVHSHPTPLKFKNPLDFFLTLYKYKPNFRISQVILICFEYVQFLTVIRKNNYKSTLKISTYSHFLSKSFIPFNTKKNLPYISSQEVGSSGVGNGTKNVKSFDIEANDIKRENHNFEI